MDVVLPIVFLSIVIFVVYLLLQKIIKFKRERFIRQYEFPKTIRNNVANTYPHLTDVELDKVISSLRTYFQIIALSQRKMIAMPSQVVDVAWHEFILFTREYRQFCSRGLGRFLHHTPAEAMKSKNHAQGGIKSAWRIACHTENINPFKPKRLPMLFALDATLRIQDGFHYELDCMRQGYSNSGGSSGYCGTHIGCSSGCAGSAGDGGCSGDGGGGGGCGGS